VWCNATLVVDECPCRGPLTTGAPQSKAGLEDRVRLPVSVSRGTYRPGGSLGLWLHRSSLGRIVGFYEHWGILCGVCLGLRETTRVVSQNHQGAFRLHAQPLGPHVL